MTRCPSFESLSRELSAGTTPTHVAECDACGALWRDLVDLREAARSLPIEPPSEERVAELKVGLLAAVEAREARARERRPVLGLALVAASALFAVAGAGWFFGQAERDERRAEILEAAAPEAVEHLTRYAADGTRHESVRVSGGRVKLHVRKLRAAERFHVETEDATVEVRGTTFEVEVERDRLRAVRVEEGVVVVRPKQGGPVTLVAGESWTAPAVVPPTETASSAPPSAPPAASNAPPPAPSALDARPPAPATASNAPPPPTRKDRPPSAPVAAPTPPVRRVARDPAPPAAVASPAAVVPEPPAEETPVVAEPPAAVTPSTPEPERRFSAGFAALKRGELEPALAEFEALIAADRGHPLAEDARYLTILALERLGRSEALPDALAAYLEAHPHGDHADRVRLRLGLLLVGAGELERARALLSAATRSVDRAVRERAELALARLPAR